MDPAGTDSNARLLDACRSGDAEAAKRALADGADPEARDAVWDMSALALCEIAEHAHLVRLLIARGAHLVVKTSPRLKQEKLIGRYGMLASLPLAAPDRELLLAAWSGDPFWAQRALAAGADPAVGDRDGKLALDYAIESRDPDTVGLLARRTAPETLHSRTLRVLHYLARINAVLDTELLTQDTLKAIEDGLHIQLFAELIEPDTSPRHLHQTKQSLIHVLHVLAWSGAPIAAVRAKLLEKSQDDWALMLKALNEAALSDAIAGRRQD